MRITGIELQDWLIHPHLKLQLSPMTLICGPMECGKSSISDAIDFALRGLPVRISTAGERPLLIHTGAKNGCVKLTCGEAEDEVTFWRNIRDGKLVQPAPLRLPTDAVPEAVPFVLDPRRFEMALPDERRHLLLRVMRAPTTLEAIRDQLVTRGLPRASQLTATEATGLSDWVSLAERFASEARGTWKQITGEAYGTVKAENWTLDTRPVDAETVKVLERDAAMLREQISKLRSDLGEAAARSKTADWRAKRIGALRAKISSKAKGDTAEESAAKVDAAKQAVLDAEARLTALRARYQPADPLACTACGTLHKLERGKLVALPLTSTGTAVSAADLANAEATVGKAQSDLTVAQKLAEIRATDLAAIREAEVAIGELEAQPVDKGPDIDTLYAAVLKKEQTDLPAMLDKLADARATEKDAANARAAIENAKAAHLAVKEWSAIADLLKPAGLPAEWLASALGPLNAHLAELAGRAGWGAIQLSAHPTEGIAIHRGDMPYKLLSESARWRANALLSIALAEESKLRFVCLDRFDVLGVPARKPALGFLHALLRAERLDTVILLGTLTAPPAAPKDVAVHWLGPVQQQATQAAA